MITLTCARHLPGHVLLSPYLTTAPHLTGVKTEQLKGT